MDKDIITIKWGSKVETINLLEITGFNERDSYESQFNETLKTLSWINTLVSYYGKKTSFARIERNAKRGEFFLDGKVEANGGRPPSDKTVEHEINEDKGLIILDKKYNKFRLKTERLTNLTIELKLKLEVLRSLTANARAEINLQK